MTQRLKPLLKEPQGVTILGRAIVDGSRSECTRGAILENQDPETEGRGRQGQAAKVRSTTIIQLILLKERVYWGVRSNIRVMELCSPRQYINKDCDVHSGST